MACTVGHKSQNRALFFQISVKIRSICVTCRSVWIRVNINHTIRLWKKIECNRVVYLEILFQKIELNSKVK